MDVFQSREEMSVISGSMFTSEYFKVVIIKPFFKTRLANLKKVCCGLFFFFFGIKDFE